MTKEYDLVVLGGGPGGYVAAIRAAQLGMSVAIVERKQVGGTCLHQGCIPSKALLRTAEIYRQAKNAAIFGIELTDVQVNMKKAQSRKNSIIEHLHQGITSILRREKIDIYYGFGRILGPSIFSPMPGTISVEYENGEENTMLIPKYVLIATGSKPRNIPDVSVDHTYILTPQDLLELEHLPTSIIIIGGGVTGIESASMLQDLGVQVTIVEPNDILIGQDDEVRKELIKQLTARGVTFLTETAVQFDSIRIENEQVSVDVTHTESVKTITAEKVLLSVGRVANISEIGLTNTSIQVENGVIVTNEMYQTKESHIYAIGDCIGGQQLAHVASKEGIIAVEHMAGLQPEALQENLVPSCIYSYPEIAKVGFTEEEAKKQGYRVQIGKFPLQANGKAHVLGEPHGFMKIITDQDTEDVLGVHMIGANVTEMISEATLGKVLNVSAWEISQTIHPHPTLSESFQEAAMAVEKKEIHF